MAKRKQSNPRAAAIQAQAKALEKELRAKAAKLKKRGLAFQKTNLKYPAKISASVKKQVRELEGVLTGELEAIKMPKATRYKYKDSKHRVSPSGTHAIRPKEEGARRMIRRGMIATVRPLGDGHMLETIELPVNVKSVRQLRKWIESGEPDRLKHPNEYFGFRLQGHASHTALPDAASMHAYLMRYNFYIKAEEYELEASDESEAPIEFELMRVFPPDVWDKVVREEEREYKSSPEYKAMREKSRERKNLNRRIRDTQARKQKKPTPEFATIEQNKRFARGEKLRQYDKLKAKKAKDRAASDPAYAEKLKERRRAKEKRQRQKGKRK